MREGLKTIVVLGMHRTATSMTARALHESGEVWMGHRLMLDADGSEDGLYEHGPIVDLNAEILWAAGGEWDQPPNPDRIMAVGAAFTSRIQDVLGELEDEAIRRGFRSVGFKDPRLCLTIELWAPHLSNPQYIAQFRDNQQVAESLHARDGISIEWGTRLALEYNRRALTFLAATYAW